MKWAIRAAAAGCGLVLLIIVAAVAAFGDSGSCGTSTPTPNTVNPGSIVRYLEQAVPMTANAAAGVAGNLQQESSDNPREVGGGLAQWINDRWAELASWDQAHGLDPTSAQGQLAFLANDLQTAYATLTGEMNRAPDPATAAREFMSAYEVCDPAKCNPTARAQDATTALQDAGGAPVSLTGCAAGPIIDNASLGPTTDPVPGSTAGRLDMGRDGTTQQFVSPFNGIVAYSTPSDPGWQGGGYVAIQSASDPGMCFYAAEGLTPTVQQRQQVQVGQTIATPRPSPYNTIVGNYEIGRCDPANPRDTLAHNTTDPKAMVLAFEQWLESLGVVQTDNPSNAGYA